MIPRNTQPAWFYQLLSYLLPEVKPPAKPDTGYRELEYTGSPALSKQIRSGGW